VLDQIVDDPALQFKRDNFEQKYADRQRQQRKLVQTARPEHIAENTARQGIGGGGIELMDPVDDGHRPNSSIFCSEGEASSSRNTPQLDEFRVPSHNAAALRSIGIVHVLMQRISRTLH
jgi:hypothetical protein